MFTKKFIHYIQFLGLFFLTTTSLWLTGCASSTQGGIGPLSNPKAMQLVDLTNELRIRANRLNNSSTPMQPAPRSQSNNESNKDDPEASCMSSSNNEFSGTGNGYRRETALWKSSDVPSEADKQIKCLAMAQSKFDKAMGEHGMDPDIKKRERNELQDKLITASEQSCSLYKRYLNNLQSSTNFLFGATTTTFAALASGITAAPIAAKNYTTGALLSSGLGAQWSSDMFSNQLAYVISKSISAERNVALEKIRTYRANKSYDEYGISAAIGDALKYHDICSLYAGLEIMDNSVETARNPGLKQLVALSKDGTLSLDNERLVMTFGASNLAESDVVLPTDSYLQTLERINKVLQSYALLDSEKDPTLCAVGKLPLTDKPASMDASKNRSYCTFEDWAKLALDGKAVVPPDSTSLSWDRATALANTYIAASNDYRKAKSQSTGNTNGDLRIKDNAVQAAKQAIQQFNVQLRDTQNYYLGQFKTTFVDSK